MQVRDRGWQARQRAMRMGMAEVITRISGSQGVEKFSQLLSVLDRSARYVLQYRYLHKPQPGAAPETEPRLMIWIRYDRKSIDQLLQKYQLPIWGETRPETLVWIVLEDQGERRMQGRDPQSLVYQALSEQAVRRGVPVLFPLLDLDDQRQVSTGDVWGGFANALRKGAVRYAVQNILSGRVYRDSDGNWHARWLVITSNDELQWNVKGKELDQVLQAGVDGLADKLASLYAYRTDVENPSAYRIQVSGVNQLDDYARLEKYLSSISLISALSVVNVKNDSVVYEISLRSSLEDLKQFLVLGKRLMPDDQAQQQYSEAQRQKGHTGIAPVGKQQKQIIFYRMAP
jgi:hypothetical protein